MILIQYLMVFCENEYIYCRNKCCVKTLLLTIYSFNLYEVFKYFHFTVIITGTDIVLTTLGSYLHVLAC